MNFEEIRHYLPGDDIRNMDWKVTARTRKPHVRVYTEERDRPVLLLIDQRITMFFGSRRNMKSNTAAEIAALAAWRVLSVGDRVGAIVFDDRDMTMIEPHRSSRRVMRILRAVVQKNHELALGKGIESNPGMINEVFERAAREAKHDYLVCSIGDGAGVDRETVRLATLLTAHNDMLAALVCDPLEADFPDAGKVAVAENELQLDVDSSDGKFRRMFKEDFEQRLQWIREMSRLRSIPLLPVHTAEGAAEQLRRVIGGR